MVVVVPEQWVWVPAHPAPISQRGKWRPRGVRGLWQFGNQRWSWDWNPSFQNTGPLSLITPNLNTHLRFVNSTGYVSVFLHTIPERLLNMSDKRERETERYRETKREIHRETESERQKKGDRETKTKRDREKPIYFFKQQMPSSSPKPHQPHCYWSFKSKTTLHFIKLQFEGEKNSISHACLKYLKVSLEELICQFLNLKRKALLSSAVAERGTLLWAPSQGQEALVFMSTQALGHFAWQTVTPATSFYKTPSTGHYKSLTEYVFIASVLIYFTYFGGFIM